MIELLKVLSTPKGSNVCIK